MPRRGGEVGVATERRAGHRDGDAATEHRDGDAAMEPPRRRRSDGATTTETPRQSAKVGVATERRAGHRDGDAATEHRDGDATTERRGRDTATEHRARRRDGDAMTECRGRCRDGAVRSASQRSAEMEPPRWSVVTEMPRLSGEVDVATERRAGHCDRDAATEHRARDATTESRGRDTATEHRARTRRSCRA